MKILKVPNQRKAFTLIISCFLMSMVMFNNCAKSTLTGSSALAQGADTQALPSSATPSSASEFTPIRVLSGQTTGYTDSTGLVWSADYGFIGGLEGSNGSQNVGETPDPAIYYGQRYANGTNFSYSFAVPNGKYNVKMFFTENWQPMVGGRMFDININNITYFTDLDIYALTGGMFLPLQENAIVNVTNGNIEIDFMVGSATNPKVDAIEITAITQ